MADPRTGKSSGVWPSRRVGGRRFRSSRNLWRHRRRAHRARAAEALVATMLPTMVWSLFSRPRIPRSRRRMAPTRGFNRRNRCNLREVGPNVAPLNVMAAPAPMIVAAPAAIRSAVRPPGHRGPDARKTRSDADASSVAEYQDSFPRDPIDPRVLGGAGRRALIESTRLERGLVSVGFPMRGSCRAKTG